MKAVVGMSAAIARTAVEGVAVGREGSWERMLRDLVACIGAKVWRAAT